MKRTDEMKLKVSINSSKCKTQVLKAVTKLKGVDKVAVDAERGIITVVGDVDPVRVVKKIRNTRKMQKLFTWVHQINHWKTLSHQIIPFFLPTLNAAKSSSAMNLTLIILVAVHAPLC